MSQGDTEMKTVPPAQSVDFDVHGLHSTIRGRGIGSEFGFGQRGGFRFQAGSRPLDKDFSNVSFTANGRAALGLAARYAKRRESKDRDTVLLPAYLCFSILQPFLEMGLQVRFYPVARHMSLILSDICSRINERTLIVVLIHYFGFRQPEDIAGSLVQQFPYLTVIDDRTHLLLSDLYAGRCSSESAIAIYSPRKWGPFPDLGIVAWPRTGNSPLRGDSLLDNGYDWSFGVWRLIGGIPRGLFFAWPSETLRQLSRWPIRRAETILDRRVKVRRASPISRVLWRCWDWESAWHIRRQNCLYILENWPSSHMRPLYTKLLESGCPIGLPFRTAERDAVQQYFASRGIFLPIHWLRPSQVCADEFPDEARLADEELTIPLDQRYSLRHMDYILEAVVRA